MALFSDSGSKIAHEERQNIPHLTVAGVLYVSVLHSLYDDVMEVE